MATNKIDRFPSLGTYGLWGNRNGQIIQPWNMCMYTKWETLGWAGQYLT